MPDHSTPDTPSTERHIAPIRDGHIQEFRQQAENANLHTDRGIAALTQSVKEDGWIGAITVAADGETFDGSARLQVAQALGMDNPLVVDIDGTRPVVLRHTGIPTATSPEARRLGVGANRIAELDLEWSKPHLELMQAEGILGSLFLTDELTALTSSLISAAAPDDTLAPPPPPNPGNGGDEFEEPDTALVPTRVQPGDVWRIGPHYLLCADASDDSLVASYLRSVVEPSQRPALLVTSPPYGVGKEYEEGGIEQWLTTIRSVFDVAAHHCPLWFVNLANKRTNNDGAYEANTFGMMVDEFEQMGFPMNALRIWVKQPAWSSAAPYWHHTYKPVDDFEFLALFSDVGEPVQHKVRLERDELNEWGYRGVWEVASVQRNAQHPAAYPIELPTRAIRLFTDAGHAVYDPFAGTGTTMVAAHRLRRRARLVEIRPDYCDLCLLRAEAEGIGPIQLVRNLLRAEVEEQLQKEEALA